MKAIFHSLFILFLIKRIVAINPQSLPIETTNLLVPPLAEVAEVIEKTLKTNFHEVSVEVVDCPDLTLPPFTLASSGLGGNPKIVDIGGFAYVLPLVLQEKLYDLIDIAELIHSDPAFIIGADGGPFPYVGGGCEGITNIHISDGEVVNQGSKAAKADKSDGKVVQVDLPKNETRVAFISNLFVSEGKPGKVLKVYAKKRTGGDNFADSIRKAIVNQYKELVGIGGVFLLNEGKGTFSVMGEFSETPIDTDEKKNKWLHWYNLSAPIINVGTMVNGDGGALDLFLQHFHSFSHHGEAGHYENDTTPEDVEYLGYFNLGEKLYRIDKPENSWWRY